MSLYVRVCASACVCVCLRERLGEMEREMWVMAQVTMQQIIGVNNIIILPIN